MYILSVVILHASGGVTRVGPRSAPSSIGSPTIYRTHQFLRCYYAYISSLSIVEGDINMSVPSWRQTPKKPNFQLPVTLMGLLPTVIPITNPASFDSHNLLPVD